MHRVELSEIDPRFEHTRRRDSAAEGKLLASIMERDIQEPLRVSFCPEAKTYILHDGYKRYRCAGKLRLCIVPVECIANSVGEGVIRYFREAMGSTLSILEQAALVEELHKRHGLRVCDIALRLERSPAWVSLRLDLIGELSATVRRKILTGAFPVRAYFYGIKTFTRVNTISSQRIDALVTALSGKGLNTRELVSLCRAYFTGSETVARLILEGDARRALGMIAGGDTNAGDPSLDDAHQGFIRDLSALFGLIRRVEEHSATTGPENASFRLYVNQWSGSVLSRLPSFTRTLRGLYDRSGAAASGIDPVPARVQAQGDSAVAAGGCENHPCDCPQR